MKALEIVQKYFDAWNAHDADGIVRTFEEGGTYSDPVSGVLSGEAIGGYARQLWSAFPDLSFEITGVKEAASGLAAEWTMRGANTGPYAGMPPTGRTVEVAGADFIDVGDAGLRSVRGYFDSRAVPSQLGLQVVIQPHAAGPFTFGSAVAVQSGKQTPPGAFSITELRALSPESGKRISEYSRKIAPEMLAMPGFIGWVGVVVGQRMMTITAWERPEDVDSLSRGAHREAMDYFMSGEAAVGGFTSIWVPGRINARLLRCNACARMNNYERSEGRCSCGQPLPEPLPYW